MAIHTNNTEEAGAAVPSRGKWRKRVSWFVVIAVVLVAVAALMHQVGLWRARVAIEARRHQAAATWLNVTGFTWPKNAEWYYLSAIVNRRLKQYQAVGRYLKKAHELGWPVADLEREQTIAHAQSGQFKKVGDQWPKLLMNAGSDGPEICRAYVNYALSGFRLELAASIIKSWKADFPDDPGPYVVEGNIASVLLRWAEAEKLYREALKRDPGEREARRKLAEALMKQLKFEDAEKQLRLVFDGEPRTADVRADLAHCMAQQKRMDEALSLLNDGLERDPENLRLLAESGRLNLMKGDNDKALKLLAAVLEREPENTELRYFYAQALRNAGKAEEAQKHIRLVDEGTKALLELKKLKTAVVQNPSNVEMRYQVAATTWKWKSRAEGHTWLLSVLEFDPHHKETHALLAQHYESVGDTSAAERHRKLGKGG